MNESPVLCSDNPVYEKIDEPASLNSFRLSENTRRTEESGHSSIDHSNRNKVNPRNANLARRRGSKRALFALVILVGLLSFLVLLLTVLNFYSLNEGEYTE